MGAGESIDGLSQAAVSGNRLSGNRLSGNRLSGNRLSGNRLSGNRLSGNSLSANLDALDGLHETEEGRELLTYIVKCALPEDQELVVLDQDGGTHRYSFSGLLGLTPEWMDGPLPERGQRWITACLMAHVNAFGIEVPISVRGPHHELATSEQEEIDFSVSEGAFYGNIFQDIDGDGWSDPQMYSCRGAGHASDSPYLVDRVCTQPSGKNDGLTRCGFIDMGICQDRSQAETVCASSSDSSGYQDCRDDQTQGASATHTGERYTEVISIHLMD